MAYGMGSSNFSTPMGMAGKPKGLFGKMIRNPLEGTGVVQHSSQERINQQPQPEPKKPGFFDKGGGSQYVFAGLQDFLQRRMGEQPTGVSNLMQRQMAEQQAAAQASQAQLQRAQELVDYEYKKGIDQKYATPDTYRWRSNSGDLMEMGPDGQPRVAYDDPTDKIQWVRAENGDGTFTMVPVGANGPVGGGGPLPEFTEDDWNSAGGGTGNGVGGF